MDDVHGTCQNRMCDDDGLWHEEACVLARRVAEAEAENRYLRRALERIANDDYRGNEPHHVTIARKALSSL